MDIDTPISNPGNDPSSDPFGLGQELQSGRGVTDVLQLPTFSSSFPLPFRVLALIGFAILLWAIDLHVLSALGIDTSWALDVGEKVGTDADVVEEAYEMNRTRQVEEDGTDDVDLRKGLLAHMDPESGTITPVSGDAAFPVISLDTPRLQQSSKLHISIPSEASPTLSALNSPGLPTGSLALGGMLQRVPPKALYGPVYKLFLLYTVWVGSGWLIFSWMTRTQGDGDDDLLRGVDELDPSQVEEAMGRMLEQQVRSQRESMESVGVRLLIAVIMVGAAVGIAAPWKGTGKQYRRAFTKSFHRIIRPRLFRPPYFSDVILADISTSFAKVLGDLIVSSHQLWGGGISRGRVRLEGAGQWIVLGMVCLPYLLRFQQCIFEYLNPRNTSSRPLLNALKYASAFPVIFLSAMQRNVIKEVALMKGKTVAELAGGGRWFGEHRLFRLWLLAVIFNSMYSFWWDVTNDWGLCLLTPSTWAKQSSSQTGLWVHTGDSPRIHLRTTSMSGNRTPIRPMMFTRLAQGLLRTLGFGRDTTASSPGSQASGPSFAHRMGHQRSPYPSPALHGRATSTDLSIKMDDFNSSDRDARSAPPGSLYPPASSAGTTSTISFSTSAKPLLSNRYITIPNPLYLGLRGTLLFPDPLVYHLFICIDFVLRFIWSLKLSSHLHTISEIESGVFIMEALELMRRWMWVFLRVEWEVVKKMEASRARERISSDGEAMGLGLTGDRTGNGAGVGLGTDSAAPTSPRRRSGGVRAPVLPPDEDGLELDGRSLSGYASDSKEPTIR